MGIPLFFNTIARDYGDIIDNQIPKYKWSFRFKLCYSSMLSKSVG